MAGDKFKQSRGSISQFFFWFTSTFLLLLFSLSAAAQAKKPSNTVRSQVKISRLQSELSGTNFEPTVEMMKNSPDLVKKEMRLFEQHSGKLTDLNNKIKKAQIELKLYERLHKQKSASEAEVRKKTNDLKILQARMLRMRTQTLVELETEMMRDAEYNNNTEMPLKIQMARIAAELNDQPFQPTAEMVQEAPDFVKMQQNLNQAHNDYSDVIDARVNMADEELRLAESAFKKGVISKSEYLIIKTSQNNLVSESLNIHCKILNHSEQIKIQTSDKPNLAQQLKAERIKAQVNQGEFNPTDEMKELMPNLVQLEADLFKCNQSRMKRLSDSEQMLAEKYQIAKKAHNQGLATNAELNLAKSHLRNFKNYHQRVKAQFQKEMQLVVASLDKNVDAS